jgi:hypothetical protein
LAVIAVVDHPDPVKPVVESGIVERDAVPGAARLTLHHMHIGQTKEIEAFNDMIEKRLRVAVV